MTVIVPTHNPDLRPFRAVLDGLRRQDLPPEQWEAIIIDNASTAFPSAANYADVCPRNSRVVSEKRLGLTWARRRGIQDSSAPFVVFVDDDNVLGPDYLSNVLSIFTAFPRVGVIGGKSIPQFESKPPPWANEFFALLALRDPGPVQLISNGLIPPCSSTGAYPAFAPIGAGMAARRAAFAGWLEQSFDTSSALSDRRGSELASGGDNDIVVFAMRAGWEVGYFPQLSLTHLIPAARLEAGYLARLNRGIQKSWMQVLSRHGINSWPPISSWTVPLRKLKMWWSHRAWRGPAEHIRWQGACGHFEGRSLRFRHHSA